MFSIKFMTLHSPGEAIFFKQFFLKVQKESTFDSGYELCSRLLPSLSSMKRPSTIFARRDIRASVIKITSDSVADPRETTGVMSVIKVIRSTSGRVVAKIDSATAPRKRDR